MSKCNNSQSLAEYMAKLTPEESAEIANQVDRRINKSLTEAHM